MRHHLRFTSGGHAGHAIVALTLAGASLAAAFGCGSGALTDNPSGSLTEADAGAESDAGDGINATGVGAGTGANTGLPCDVQQLLENRCIGCHLSKSPPPLLTLADLTAPSPSDPTKTMAAEALLRMQDTASPMPPPPAEAPTPDEIAVFQAWVTAKLPAGAVCSGADGGVPVTVVDTPTVCTSGKTWTRGNDGSSSMQPGAACITCHTMRGGPAFKIAGTVYPTAHEPNECDGVAGGLTVVVTDARGTVTKVAVNSAGNFYARGTIVPPFHVKVTDGTKERAMTDALTAGDCNSCHTEQGVNGAPGRILAP